MPFFKILQPIASFLYFFIPDPMPCFHTYNYIQAIYKRKFGCTIIFTIFMQAIAFTKYA